MTQQIHLKNLVSVHQCSQQHCSRQLEGRDNPDEWLKRWCVHITVLFTAATWMDPGNTVLSEGAVHRGWGLRGAPGANAQKSKHAQRQRTDVCGAAAYGRGVSFWEDEMFYN